MALDQYTHVFVIGTFFALLDAFNNGANDVANAWASSVSSKSITYRQAMICGTIFEMVGAITVGARTAQTIKNGIIPTSAFKGDAGVQMLAFTCALAGASSWVMWCTRHSANVSSTYSLISAVAGVGVATVGASNVKWGWSHGKGLGAIFAGLGMAPVIAAGFGATMFMFIKILVHLRKNPVKWAIYSSPLWFFVAGTICSLSIVYKGSPRLKLDEKPMWDVAAIALGTGGSLALLAGIFLVPFVHTRSVKKDASLQWWQCFQGPLLYRRPNSTSLDRGIFPDYNLGQEEQFEHSSTSTLAVNEYESTKSDEIKIVPVTSNSNEKTLVISEVYTTPTTYKEIMAEADRKLKERLMNIRGPMGWAMRTLRDNQLGPGETYEIHNIIILIKRLPAQITCGLLYGFHYDLHAPHNFLRGIPEDKRMERIQFHAEKYPNEVEHIYSFVQILTACTASFAHGANDIGNSVGPWAVIYGAWSTGNAAQSEAPVPIWQLVVLSATISIGLCTYGYNIMKVMGNKITYHSPSRGCSIELGAAVTVLLFSQFSIPISTSMCITGASIGVGLCNGTLKAVNWHRVGLLLTAWIATVPVAGTIAGVLMAVVLNAPHFVS